MTDSIRDKVIFQEQGKTVQPLFSDSFKVVGIGLMTGQTLEKHKAPAAAFLLVQEGMIEFRLSAAKHILKTGDYMRIPPMEEHELKALEDSRLVLVR